MANRWSDWLQIPQRLQDGLVLLGALVKEVGRLADALQGLEQSYDVVHDLKPQPVSELDEGPKLELELKEKPKN